MQPARPVAQVCVAVAGADGARSMSLRHTATTWGFAAADPPRGRFPAISLTFPSGPENILGGLWSNSFVAAIGRSLDATQARSRTDHRFIRRSGTTGDVGELAAAFGAGSVEVVTEQ